MKSILSPNAIEGKLNRIGKNPSTYLFCAFCEEELGYLLKEAILVSLIIGVKDTSFALHCEKVLFSLEFRFILEKLYWHRQNSGKKNSSLPNSDVYKLTIKSYRIKATEFGSFGII